MQSISFWKFGTRLGVTAARLQELEQVLDGYGNVLREKELALAKHQPYLVRWMKDLLLCALDHGGYRTWSWSRR